MINISTLGRRREREPGPNMDDCIMFGIAKGIQAHHYYRFVRSG